jgi:transcriptional regulator with XRE-family HTH domain
MASHLSVKNMAIDMPEGSLLKRFQPILDCDAAITNGAKHFRMVKKAAKRLPAIHRGGRMKSKGEVRADLGRRVREVRKERDLTLDELGSRIGLSASTLSKIENATLSVTYDTLLSLAEALDIDVTSLFGAPGTRQPTARRVINRAGHGEIYDVPVYQYEMLCADLSNKKMIPIVATIKADTISAFPKLITHEGEEFIYILEGQVELHTEHYAPVMLNRGDSAYYDSKMGHAVIAAGGAEAKILWTCTNLKGVALERSVSTSRTSPTIAQEQIA